MSLERNSPRPDFDRRRKNNRSIDSICLHCCSTVATASSELELAAKEARHLCSKRQEKMMRQHLPKKEDAA
jgi:hypothetical protein